MQFHSGRLLCRLIASAKALRFRVERRKAGGKVEHLQTTSPPLLVMQAMLRNQKTPTEQLETIQLTRWRPTLISAKDSLSPWFSTLRVVTNPAPHSPTSIMKTADDSLSPSGARPQNSTMTAGPEIFRHHGIARTIVTSNGSKEHDERKPTRLFHWTFDVLQRVCSKHGYSSGAIVL